ncbi:MAG: hypothetical protein IMZ61_03200 [Planctomycetes bacterium]|nr:hypothetical protein [Planctomycetota bacterium]
MSIQKYYEIACDYCHSAITHSIAGSKKDAVQEMIEDGGVLYKGKHYCSNKCKSKGGAE